jgi:TonB family protein
MSNRTILLIDYDPQAIESAIQPLTNAGFTVEVANDGVAGLAAFERLHPDLVIIEPMVPKKHGFEVCQEIKRSAHGKSTPVLITTGFYRGRKHELEAKQFYGCDAYLEKPVAEELLVSTCRKCLPDEATEPRLLEDLESDTSATARVPEDGLPALEELSEDEIVARLDDLIKEDPGLFADQPALADLESPPAASHGAAGRSEPDSAQAAPGAVPTAASTDRAQPVESSSTEGPLVVPDHEPVPLATPAAVTYGTSRPRPKPSEPPAAPAGPTSGAPGAEPPAAEPRTVPVAATSVTPGAKPRAAEPRTAPVAATSATPGAEPQAAEPRTVPVAATSATPGAEPQAAEPPAISPRVPPRPTARPARPRPTPERSVAKPDPAPSSRRRLWIFAAAVGLLAAAAAGVVLVPRWLGADAAPVIASAAPQTEVASPEPSDSPLPPPPATAGQTPAEGAEPAGTEEVSEDGPVAPEAGAERPASAAAAAGPKDEPGTPAGPDRPAATRRTQARPTRRPPQSATSETQPTPQARQKEQASNASTRQPEATPTGPTADSTPTGAAEDSPALVAPEATPPPAPVETRGTDESPTADDAGSTPPVPPVASDDAATAKALEPVETTAETTLPISETAQAPQPVQENGASGSATPAAAEEPPVEQPKVTLGELLDISEVDTPPEPLDKRPPEYPALARRLRLEGRVSLRLLVDERGKVTVVETIAGDPNGVLSGAAERAAREWTFRPARKDDVPVKVWIVEHLAFRR